MNIPDKYSVTTETEIKGIKRNYDACSSGSLKVAKSFYEHAFRYIGSSQVLILNGIRAQSKEMYHFFVYKKSYK